MHYWILFSLVVTLNAFADNTFYDTLKQMPPPSDTFEVSTDPRPLKDDGLSVVRPINDVAIDYLPTTINVNEELPPRYQAVIEDSVYLQAVML